MKSYPPSLPEDLKARSFVAAKGELGLCPSDVSAFLDVCYAGDIAVLGWEAWIINHREPREFSPGSWFGLIPLQNDSTAVIGGDGDVDEVRRQCAAFEPDTEVATAWLPHLRVNISIDR